MIIVYDNWQDIAIEDWLWGPYFSPKEMRCRGTGELRINHGSMDKLLAIRKAAGFPFPITSAGRSPEYNVKISSSGEAGPHVLAQAFDIGVHGEQAYWLVNNAAKFGFTGIGLKQKGPFSQRFVHLDDATEIKGPRPWVWTY